MRDFLIIFLPFLVLLAFAVWLHRKKDEPIDIRTPDLVFAALPIALWMLVSGRIASLSVGDLTITAIQNAAAEPVAGDAHPLDATLPVETMRASEKGAVTRIPDLLAQQTEALTFRLGARGYDAWAIGQYFEQLAAGPDLRWVVVEDESGRFWGLSDARTLESLVRNKRLSLEELTSHLNAGEPADRDWLAHALPVFASADQALSAEATRQDALERFGRTTANVLPALDGSGRLRGLVRRDALVTGLLADVTARLDGKR